MSSALYWIYAIRGSDIAAGGGGFPVMRRCMVEANFASIKHSFSPDPASLLPCVEWGFFCSTLVYAFSRPDRTEHCVMFWDTK